MNIGNRVHPGRWPIFYMGNHGGVWRGVWGRLDRIFYALGLLCLLLCSCKRMESIAVSPAFSPEETEMVMAAIDAWVEHVPEVGGLDVVVSDRLAGGAIRPSKKGACKKDSTLGVTVITAVRAPVINICPEAMKRDLLYETVLHELGHALALRRDHLPSGNVMAKSSGGASKGITEKDVSYVDW